MHNPDTLGLCSTCYKKQTGGAASPAKKPSAEGKNKEAVVLRTTVVGGVTLAVTLGDMTTEKVDAIVNAANSRLDHASGLAGAIIKQGGEIIQFESDEYVATHGPLEDGDVMVTSAGELPSKHVIHAVGPMYNDGTQGEELILQLCINNILQRATDMKWTSVSIPAISSGIFKFPKPLCAQVLFDSVLQFFSNAAGSTVKNVRFTNFDQETVDCFTKEFDKRYPDAKKPELPVAPPPPAGPVHIPPGGGGGHHGGGGLRLMKAAAVQESAMDDLQLARDEVEDK